MLVPQRGPLVVLTDLDEALVQRLCLELEGALPGGRQLLHSLDELLRQGPVRLEDSHAPLEDLLLVS